MDSHMRPRRGELSGASALRPESPNAPSTLVATLIYYYK